MLPKAFLALACCLACCFACCSAYVTSFECANVTHHSHDVRMNVSGCCAEDEFCPLRKNTTHSVDIFFCAGRSFCGKVDLRVSGVFASFAVPYGRRTDACHASAAQDGGAPCRETGCFEAGRCYRLSSTFFVSASYPKVRLRVQFVVQDRRSKALLMCVQVPVEIE